MRRRIRVVLFITDDFDPENHGLVVENIPEEDMEGELDDALKGETEDDLEGMLRDYPYTIDDVVVEDDVP